MKKEWYQRVMKTESKIQVLPVNILANENGRKQIKVSWSIIEDLEKQQLVWSGI